MSEIVSVVSGEAEESDTDGEISSNDNSGGEGTTTNDDATDSAGASGTSDGLRPSRPPRARPLRTLSAQPGVIVQGEASETDSDEEAANTKPKRSVSDPVGHDGLPPLKVELPSRKEDPRLLQKKRDQSQNDTLPPHKEVPKYDTLLHRKLRERNASLQTDVYETVASIFHTSARELGEANQMLGKSQSVIQDVCHNLRVFTTDLKKIEQRLDTINSCSNIPNITIDLRGGS